MHELPSITKPALTHTQLVRYAGASGDFNPIHTVVPLAQKAGLPDVIAHGMLVMGFAGEALCKWFARKQLCNWKVRFMKMSFPGEVLTVHGAITSELQKDGKAYLMGELSVVNEAGEVKLKGQFEVLRSEDGWN